jgi:translation initiation factor eIF-2B subunit gamma
MLCWTVDWLLASGIRTVSVVVDARSSTKVNHVINKAYGQLDRSQANISIVSMDEHKGTVSVLADIADRMGSGQSNILLVPCDLCTNREGLLSAMADQHRLQRAGLTALLVPEQMAISGGCPAPTNQQPDDADFEGEEKGDAVIVAIDERNANQLVFYGSKSDVEADGVWPVSTSTMITHPNLKLRMDLMDVHCYIIAKGLLQSQVFKRPGIFSFREEALPRLVRDASLPGPIQAYILEGPSTLFTLAATSYCLRANSICSYLLANRTLAKHHQGIRVPASCDIAPKSQIGADSIIGEHCRLGEKSTVKKSVVGSHVIIGTNVKITNSVILDNCVVEDGVKIDGCIISGRVVVKEKANLKKCEVAGLFTVEAGLAAKGEVLGASRELQNMFD